MRKSEIGVFVLSLALFIALWYLGIWLFKVPSFIIPTPSQVIVSFYDGLARPVSDPTGLVYHGVFTAYEAIVGYVVGALTGILFAVLLAELPSLERVFSPYVMALQSLPKVAVAPLFLIWFGYGMSSKVMVVLLLTFFPLLVNTLDGLKTADVDQANLMKLLKASRWQTLWMVKLPFALPHIFSGLQIAMVQSIVGALVGEFVGGRRGLGTLLLQRQSMADVGGVFAIFVLLSIMGFIGYGILTIAQRRFLFWAHRLSG